MPQIIEMQIHYPPQLAACCPIGPVAHATARVQRMVYGLDVGHDRANRVSAAQTAHARGQRWLRNISIVLVALGLAGTVGNVVTGDHRPSAAPAPELRLRSWSRAGR